MADVTSLLTRFIDQYLWRHFAQATGGPAGTLYVGTTNVGNVGGGTDDLMSFAVPAGTLSRTGQALRVTAWGTTANNANAKTLTMAFGTDTIMTQALTVNLAGTWRIVAYIARTGAATQDAFAELLQLTTVVDKQTLTSASQDLTAAVTVKCTGAGTNNNDILQDGMVVELLN